MTIKFIPYNGNYVTDISTALAGGTAADMVVPTAMQQIWTDVAKGYWEDLTPYVRPSPIPICPTINRSPPALLPSALRPCATTTASSTCWPATAVDGAFYYNKAIFAKAGIKAAATWDQFIADLKAIKAAGYVPFEVPLGGHCV